MSKIWNFLKSIFSKKKKQVVVQKVTSPEVFGDVWMGEPRAELINDGSFNDGSFTAVVCEKSPCCGDGSCKSEISNTINLLPKKNKAPSKKKEMGAEVVKKAPAKKRVAKPKKDKE